VPDIDQFIPASLRLLVTLAAIGLSAFVLYRSTTAKTWKDERDAALAKADRLAVENKSLNEKVAVLEAQRDLTSVQEGQTAIVRALDALSAHEAERHAATMGAVTQNTEALNRMAGAFESYQQVSAEMVLLLRDINNNTRG
jgi:hypothetical protein